MPPVKSSAVAMATLNPSKLYFLRRASPDDTIFRKENERFNRVGIFR
jgi:hypothetical protein